MEYINDLEKTILEVELIVDSELEVDQKYKLIFPRLENKFISQLETLGFQFNFNCPKQETKSMFLMAFLMHMKAFLNNVRAKKHHN